MAGYVLVGVDEINQYYICYFSWANPVILVLVSLIAVAELLASAGLAVTDGGGGGRLVGVRGGARDPS